MNSSVHSAIQCCPAQLVFTDAIDLDRHIIHEPLARDTVSLPEWHKVVVEAQAYLIVAVQKLLKDVDEAHRMKRQRPGQISTYPVGSYVLVQHLSGLGRPPTKNHMLWLGPYRVIKVVSDQVTVQDVIHGRARAIHIKATRPFNMDPDHVNPVDIRRRDTDEFIVERIVDHIDKTPLNVKNGPKKNALQFKVRWLGYGKKHDTWEPWVHLCNNICLHRYLHDNGLDRLIPKDQRRADYDLSLDDLIPQWE
jgi:Chromo (CHRromatin Organisation MOdifier) domain